MRPNQFADDSAATIFGREKLSLVNEYYIRVLSCWSVKVAGTADCLLCTKCLWGLILDSNVDVVRLRTRQHKVLCAVNWEIGIAIKTVVCCKMMTLQFLRHDSFISKHFLRQHYLLRDTRIKRQHIAFPRQF